MGNAARLSILLGVLAVGGSFAGPAFSLTQAADVQSFTETMLPEKTVSSGVEGGAAQEFLLGRDIPAEWWELFKSPELDEIISAALDGNPPLAAAQASLREARENYNARAGGEYFPEVNANLSSSKMKSSPAAAGMPDGTKGSIFDLHNASVDVSYTFDIFGSGRRELDALRALVDHQNFQLEAAYLALTANVVTTVIREASLREQLSALNDIVLSQEEHLSMLDKQVALGGAARADVLAQRALLEQTRATLPPVEKELSQARHQLAALTGRFPSEDSRVATFSLSRITLPQDLPVSLPSLLVTQRPDIRAAEALLRQALAKVGGATADLYPKFTLTGSYGSQAGQMDSLFDANSMVWNIGAGIVQPTFNGGKLRARRRAAMAAYDAASANFRQTVLLSYVNVADALRALETDARTLKAQSDAEAAAKESLEMVRQQFQSGAVNYILFLNAQRQYQQARIGLIQARAARLSDTAALFQALGGGWWNRTVLVPAEKSKE